MLIRVYFVAVFCFILVVSFQNVQRDRVFLKHPQFQNLASKRDLVVYLQALNRIIDFSEKQENGLDINVYFGLFLANVNLRHAYREKHEVLPKTLRNYLNGILRKTEFLLDFFQHSIKQNNDVLYSKYKAILSLLLNPTTWVNRLPKFNPTPLNIELLNVEKDYMKWILYRRHVDNGTASVPTPHQSDLCLASLAAAEEIQFRTSRRCKVSNSCLEMVENGTDFGYALAHRLLFLQQARFSRGCSVFSEPEDIQMGRTFCSLAYRDVEYIAIHDFEIVDLLLEHVCLCALEGHAQFLRRSWLTKILSFQTMRGCFSPRPESTLRHIARTNHGEDGYCNSHTSAVAAGALAVASRFILHFYY